MPDPDQCASHTRTPWGTSAHRLRPSLRHVAMGLLLFAFVAVVVLVLVFVIGHSTFWASREDPNLNSVQAAGGIAFVMNQHNSRDLGLEFACAEQLKGCKAEGSMNFCCPYGTVCEDNTFSPSGISCCPPESSCNLDTPPSCTSGTIACPASLGGGCCPIPSICSLDGCITEFLAPPRLDSEHDDEDVVKAELPTAVGGERPSRIDGEEKATHTGPKFGELAIVLSGNSQSKVVKNGVPDRANADEDETGVTFVEGKGSKDSRIKSRPSPGQVWKNSQSSKVSLPKWLSVVMPAAAVDAIILLR